MTKKYFFIFIILTVLIFPKKVLCFTFGNDGISLNEFFSQCEFITEKVCEIYNLKQIQKESDLTKVTDSLSNSSILNSLKLIKEKGTDWQSRSIIMFSMAIAFRVINMDDNIKLLINSSVDNNKTQKNIQIVLMNGFNSLSKVYLMFNEKKLIAGTPVAFINKLKEYMIKLDTDICQKYSGHETLTKKDLEIIDDLNKSQKQLNELKK